MMSNESSEEQIEPAERNPDFVAGGIMVAAIIMFIGTGGNVLPEVARQLLGFGNAPDRFATSAFLLNIALIIFGWRRFGELSMQIVHHKAAEMEAKALAFTDALTGCINRRAIGEATISLMEAARDKGRTVAFIMVDLDNFKNVNDIQGHEAGDRVLVDVARRLQAAMPPESCVARLGGDEFACAFPFDPGFPETVQRIVEDIIERISHPIGGLPKIEPVIVSDQFANDTSVTASLGIARADQCDDNLETLMRRADIAMYFSKKQGRNCYNWFDMRMEQEIQFRNQIESGMRAGISRGEFVPYYEQQIDLSTGKLLGFEVLARWNSEELGLVSPEIFIPIAEETGMIGDLSTSVVRQAMHDARNWDPSLTISVNISPVQLRDPWFAQKIVKLLVETGFPANRLEIEITESCLFENIGLAQSIIGSLKNQGVRIALDDFGTGYSSLAHLRALPFDRIKIDRSFVASMGQSKESRAIVKTIALLGDTMGLPITAEGIEDGELLDHLRDMGCAKGQGFHFGQPLTIEQTQLLLAEQNLLAAHAPPPVVPIPTINPAHTPDQDDQGEGYPRRAAGGAD